MDYGGGCSPKCLDGYGCTGPTPKDCVKCTNNSVRNEAGECVCVGYYGGDACLERADSIISGREDSTYNTYYGNKTEKYYFDGYGHADYMDDTGYVNAKYYTGPYHDTGYDSGYYSDNNYYKSYGSDYGTYQYPGNGYAGMHYPDGYMFKDDHKYANYGGYFPCDVRCYGGCVGPTNRDCVACVPHASKDYYGSCVCDVGWRGDDCSNGEDSQCDPKCNGCTGPDACDCIRCVENASLNMYGYCVCNPNWGGLDCNAWLGQCSPRCQGGCHGPDACHCEVCISNAYLDASGYCTCTPYWSGPDCSTYSGPCNSKCYGCSGPDPCDCVECVPHAMKDQ